DGSSRRIAEVLTGDRVLGHDGEAHVVLATTSHRHDDTMRRVEITGHGSLVITRDHPMLIIRRESANETDATERAEWVPAGEVHAGDYVAYPRAALVTAGGAPSKPEYMLRSIAANGERPH